MNLLEESRSLLEAASYRTLPQPHAAGVCYFEDATVIGAVFIYESTRALLEKWESNQDRFLGQHSASLRQEPVKVWNIYTVHLSDDSVAPSTMQDPLDIEQDFRGTRKIVRTGIAGKSDLRDALLPLLDIQHRVVASPKHVSQRLKERLSQSSSVLSRMIEDANESQIAQELLEE